MTVWCSALALQVVECVDVAVWCSVLALQCDGVYWRCSVVKCVGVAVWCSVLASSTSGYGAATCSRRLEIMGLFCKRAL